MAQDPQDERPVRTMIRSWVVFIVPVAVMAWSLFQQWMIVVTVIFSIPLLAILQGTLQILFYRVCFGDSPLPQKPSHGVVLVRPKDRPEQRVSNVPSQLSLGCDCRNAQQSLNHHSEYLNEVAADEDKPPLRLLVIGDSLAIGVGQATCCTPILPETIAKTLSKRMGGHVVYWTCHGAPGASAGWIVRELERGIHYLKQDDDESNLHDEPENVDDIGKVEVQSSCSETDDSSSDASDSAMSGIVLPEDQQELRQEQRESLKVWRERLAQHRKRFDPEVLGPYDIAVVMTGSNDLKSAFFPFLLRGEDAEFRRQAKERGGCYAKELRRLIETLNCRMRLRLQNIRESVEAATESVRERVEETLEFIGPGASHLIHRKSGRHQFQKHNESVHHESPTSAESCESENSKAHFPLVVLPGMPSRVLPIFQWQPLRWLVVPIVDSMDMYKRKLAASHPGEVLFVRPPSEEDLGAYSDESGELWEQRLREDTILSVKDIRRQDCRRIGEEMRDYYQGKGNSSAKSEDPRYSHFKSFCVDGIHPNDLGYDFWGRHIGNAIYDEWRRQHPCS